MFGVREVRVLPADQLAPVREDLRQALASADERERPGLEAALRLVEGYTPEELRRRWVAGILAETAVDPKTDTVNAVRDLRRAVPSLSLTDAVTLVKELAAQDENSRLP